MINPIVDARPIRRDGYRAHTDKGVGRWERWSRKTENLAVFDIKLSACGDSSRFF
jgi:hypothetical protein